MYQRSLVFLVAVTVLLVACGKSEPKAEGAQSGAVVGATSVVATSGAPASGAEDLGIDLYPGMVALMEAQRLPGDNSAYMITSTYKSDDKPEKVAAFFREQMSKKFGGAKGVGEIPMGEGMTHLVGGSDESPRTFDITLRPEGDGTMATINVVVKASAGLK